jgi:hypothetical protein
MVPRTIIPSTMNRRRMTHGGQLCRKMAIINAKEEDHGKGFYSSLREPTWNVGRYG